MGTDALTPLDILTSIHVHPRKLQSNFCRDHAGTVARLASLGLISTRAGETFGNSWRCTWRGLKVLDSASQDLDE